MVLCGLPMNADRYKLIPREREESRVGLMGGKVLEKH